MHADHDKTSAEIVWQEGVLPGEVAIDEILYAIQAVEIENLEYFLL